MEAMDCARIDCDVLVVGAGPAGGSAAFEAASNGLDVVILEKRREVGLPVRCAEYIPSQLVREVNLPTHIKIQKIEAMRTYMPDGEVVTTRSPGFIINRDRFDKYLVRRATSKGARLFLETKAVSYDGRAVLAKTREGSLRISPKIIIGADGPLSTIGSWIKSTNREFIRAVQYVMPLRERKTHTQVYFSQNIPGGYGWVFPKGDLANVGLGVNPGLGKTPKAALDSFVSQLVNEGVVEPEVLKRTGGLIPTGGLIKLCQGNIVLVGDAGGLVHPITGAGIASAVLSGKIAGGFVCRAAAADDIRLLAEYEIECREFFFDIFARAHRKKKLLEKYWQRGANDLSKALKWGWVAFRDYYQ